MPLLAYGPHVQKLLASRTRVLVAVSGGPDSQALLDCIGQWRQAMGLIVWAVGIDHGLRPAARNELALAQKLATHHGIPFIVRRVAVAAAGNTLAAARKARYRALTRTAQTLGAQAILVAHTANDQVETVLFHLARGTGLRGAAGIPVQRGLIVRPLMQATRAQIMQHLHAEAIGYAQDPSNTLRMRGHMRREMMGPLRALNARYVEHIAAFAEVARQEDRLLQLWADRVCKRCQKEDGRLLDGGCVAQVPHALWPRVLRAWLKPFRMRPSSAALGRLCHALANPHAPLAQGAMAGGVVRRRGHTLEACPSHLMPSRRAGT
jgi:tRNA(Ile)-lysidine synthase